MTRLPKVGIILLLVFGRINGFPWQQDTAVCTSHNQLCDVSFEVITPGTEPDPYSTPSNIPMCRCPGSNPCPNGRRESSRVHYQEITLPGMSIQTRLSFCDVNSTPQRFCKHGEVAITLRGFGPVITDVVGGVRCKCRGPVLLKKAYPDGMLSVRQFVCGQKTCSINSTTRPVCERVTPGKSGIGRVSEIPCQCPAQYYCNVNGIGVSDVSQTFNFYCEPIHGWRR